MLQKKCVGYLLKQLPKILELMPSPCHMHMLPGRDNIDIDCELHQLRQLALARFLHLQNNRALINLRQNATLAAK